VQRSKEQVNPVRHILATAGGWGGNPPGDATYVSVFPDYNDGHIPYQLTVADVPVDGFWSISVYNEDGFFEPNAQNRYAINSVTAVRIAGEPVIVHFGGDPDAVSQLPICRGWNYVGRLYQPRASILDGSWAFPRAQPST
jgi:hypothetical protein